MPETINALFPEFNADERVIELPLISQSVKSAIVSPAAIGLQGFPCCLGIMEQTESVSCGWVLKPIDGKS